MTSRFRHSTLLRAIERHPRASREEIVAFQSRHLRRVVAHAYANVPYYRQLFDRNGLNPRDIRGVGDLSLIPITSKQDLQGLPLEQITSQGVDPRRLSVRTTSGSSGEPFMIRHTRWDEERASAFWMRNMLYFGARRADRITAIMLSPTLPQAPVRQRKLALLKKIRAAMLKRRRDDSLTRIDCLLAPDKILDELRRLQPQVLTGYPAVLARLAEYMSEAPQHSVRPRLITTVGEVLTPLMRRQITEAFEVPVFNTYGSIEFGYMAWECKESGELHACDDSLLLEVLQDSRPVETGEHGEVVGTNLHNLTIPFLRYRLSDIVTKGSEVCSCGQPFSTIREVEGRRMDFFQLPDGRLVHPYEIERAVRPLIPRIRQYQLEQERENLIIARVVLADSPSPQELAQMQVRLQECVISLLGPEVEFRVEAVSQIPLEPNGKFRVYRSRIAPDGE